jgi:hypothetical protein
MSIEVKISKQKSKMRRDFWLHEKNVSVAEAGIEKNSWCEDTMKYINGKLKRIIR